MSETINGDEQASLGSSGTIDEVECPHCGRTVSIDTAQVSGYGERVSHTGCACGLQLIHRPGTGWRGIRG